jgi:hypothetical protein
MERVTIERREKVMRVSLKTTLSMEWEKKIFRTVLGTKDNGKLENHTGSELVSNSGLMQHTQENFFKGENKARE